MSDDFGKIAGLTLDLQRVQQVLKQAAETCGLEDAFAHVIELGDFSVTYRAAGFLKDVKQLSTTEDPVTMTNFLALKKQVRK